MEIPEKLGFEINGPGRAYFDDVTIDNLFDSIMELSAAVWTVRDRQIVLETVLAEKGIDVTEAIETYVPDEASLAARTEERDALAARIFSGFLRRPTSEAAGSPNDPSLRDITD
ncbi:MAG: hypothetical protein AAFY82_07100 [Pseudomonadota bacterium]